MSAQFALNQTDLAVTIQGADTYPWLPSSGCHNHHCCPLLLSSGRVLHSGVLLDKYKETLKIQASFGSSDGHSYIFFFNVCHSGVLIKLVHKQPVFPLTHVGFILGHGCDCILVCCKFYVCFASDPAVWSDLYVDPHRIQWREELQRQSQLSK